MDDGRYCHDKCKQVKICFLCGEHLAASDIKNARLVPHGMWLCNDCKMCKGCFKLFKKEDLHGRRNLKRQGSQFWHEECFKCTVSVDMS